MGRFGPEVRTVDSALAVSAESTFYSTSFTLTYGVSFSAIFKAASAGTVNLLIQLEQSDVLPSTERASDANYVIPENQSDIVTLADTNVHIETFAPKATKYARFKITGQTGNAAGNTLLAKVSKVEDI